MEAIVLAGGLGTRLRGAVPDLPKCMAPVAGKPFIDHVIEEAQKQGVTRFIFALGYKHEIITSHLKKNFSSIPCFISIEDEPLGTGGGILAATSLFEEKHGIILNGDTLFRVNLQQLMNFHIQHKAICTLALKPMQHFNRYGVVKCGTGGHITAFEEKREVEEGLINGGVYALNIPRFRSLGMPKKFSFEKDFLEASINREPIMGMIHDEYFVDIGIPEDFVKANKELALT